MLINLNGVPPRHASKIPIGTEIEIQKKMTGDGIIILKY